MQRRDFLKAVGLVPLAAGLPNLAFAAAPGGNYRNLLVLIELKGGNDGLNTVVPYADPAYYDLRPRLGIPREQVIQLDSQVGLHPALQPLMSLWQARELAVVQGVGYPDPNLSHFRSIEIWDTASRSNEYLSEGWLTRAFQANPVPRSFAADGVVLGSQDLGPLAGTGARALALANTEQFLRQARLADDATTTSSNPALAHILKVEDDIVQAAAGLASNQLLRTAFPKGQLGNALNTAAQVISGNGGVAVVRVTHNGFDTHNGQPGVHQRLLKELAEGLVAFKAALQEIGRWDSTLIITYAEFGRRAQENGSLGTDHGTANTHFVLGGSVRGGLYGQAPSLTRLEGGNLVHAVDFRSLYATVIEKWWGVNSTGVLNGRFAQVNLLRV
jgi:uncharacterized protein (DUF1501 family)